MLFLGDFSFTPPTEIYAKLRQRRKGISRPRAASMPAELTTGAAAGRRDGDGKPDANDVNYDAYLANDRHWTIPRWCASRKSAGCDCGSSTAVHGTNYFIDLGSLPGELIATDGMPVKPIRHSRFPLAIAQRIDVRVQITARRRSVPHPRVARASQRADGHLPCDQRREHQAPAGEELDAPTGLLTLELEKPACGRDSFEREGGRPGLHAAAARQHGRSTTG